MGVPDHDDDLGNNDPNDANGNGRGNKFRNYRNQGDRLDLNSNLANTSLTNRDQLNKLNIEKQVELKQTKTMVPKKEIKKYQNAPYSNQQLRDLGYSDKKIPRNDGNDRDPYGGQGYAIGSDDPNYRGRNGDNNDPNNRDRNRNGDNGYGDNGDNGNNGDPNDPNNRDRNGDPNNRDRNGDPNNRDRNGDPNNRNGGYGNNGGNRDGKDRGNNRDFENEPGYKVERDNSYIRNNNQKSAIFVPINRRTVGPNEYKPVDTKLNGDEGKRVRRGYEDDAGEGYDDPKKDRSRMGGYPYDNNPQNEDDRER